MDSPRHLARRRRAGMEVASDIEVSSAGGPPEVILHGAVAERADALRLTVRISLTHTRTDAGAVAIATAND